jgi:hypothetical protein
MKLSTPQAPQAILSAVSGLIESSIGTQNYDDVSGNGLMLSLISKDVRVPNLGCPHAGTWRFVRELIGHGLRERYQVPKELPPKLLALVRNLETLESKSPRTRTLIGTLDAIEGDYLKD